MDSVILKSSLMVWAWPLNIVRDIRDAFYLLIKGYGGSTPDAAQLLKSAASSTAALLLDQERYTRMVVNEQIRMANQCQVNTDTPNANPRDL
jgi:hypothetical protein